MWLNFPDMAEQPTDPTNPIAQKQALQAFEALIQRADAEIDLAQAAFLIAHIEYSDLDSSVYTAQLDALARRVCSLLGLSGERLPVQLPIDTSPLEVITAVNRVLFEQEGFHGNKDDYYNPANSFLHKVLENHTGIPITLSLLYIEVCKRIGLAMDGIGLPLHFMVGYRFPQGNTLYIDVFHAGQLLSEQECRERIYQLAGGRIKFHRQWFEPISHRQFLVRMLSNLKHIYLHKERFYHALAVCERLVLLSPELASERRDRGIVHLHLKHYGRARQDLKKYLELAPQAQDHEEIREHIKTINQTIAMLN